MEALFIILVTFAVYYKTIRYGFIVDDVNRYKKLKCGKYDVFFRKPFLLYPLTRISESLYGAGTFYKRTPCSKGCRPASKTKCSVCNGSGYSYHINIRLDHLLTITIHATICVLMYYAFGKNMVSLMASLLYCVNPINNQTAIWMNGRRYAVSIIIVLCMVIMGRLGILLYPLIYYFQLTAFFAPVIYGGLSILICGILFLANKDKILVKINARMKTIKNDEMRLFSAKKLIPIVKYYGAYILKMIVPGRTLMCYPFLFYWGMSDEGNKKTYRMDSIFLFGVLCLVTTIVVGALLFKTHLFWMFIFMVLSIMQWCGFITVTQLLADRYVSLSNVFMTYFVVLGIHTFIPGSQIIFAMMFMYYVCNLQITMMMYKDMMSFYDYHLYFDKGNVRISEYKAAYYMNRKDPLAAFEVIKDALKIFPKDMKLNMQAALCMKMIGDEKNMLHYTRIARHNIYLGQDEHYYQFERELLLLDMRKEACAILDKTSKRPNKERDAIMRVYDYLNQNKG